MGNVGHFWSLDSNPFTKKALFSISFWCGFGVERKNGRFQGPQSEKKEQGFSSLAVQLREYSLRVNLYY